MATPTFIDFYDNFPVELGTEVHQLNTDNVNLILHDSVPTASWQNYADITNEESGTGYTAGGELLDNSTFAVSDTDQAMFDSDNEVITAGAGGLTFSHWSLMNDTPVAGNLICYGTCDGGSNIVLADTDTFTFTVTADGWFKVGLGTLT